MTDATMNHAGLIQRIKHAETRNPDALAISPLGKSVQGRAICRVALGEGPKKILLWSQMHGDEPTHTAVLLDLIEALRQGRGDDAVDAILANSTLHMIPMLNPDGAERNRRENAQEIDVNRDALQLKTPEARILKAAIEEWTPDFAFNLHNQRPHNFIETTNQPATVSLLAPPLDAENTMTEQIVTAKKIAVCFSQAVAEFCDDRVARYEAKYMPGAFGEFAQRRGAATVLVEAGGWPLNRTPTLVQIHFAGLLATLGAIATERYHNADASCYDALPRTVPWEENDE